jgi:hypothetical protein
MATNEFSECPGCTQLFVHLDTKFCSKCQALDTIESDTQRKEILVSLKACIKILAPNSFVIDLQEKPQCKGCGVTARNLHGPLCGTCARKATERKSFLFLDELALQIKTAGQNQAHLAVSSFTYLFLITQVDESTRFSWYGRTAQYTYFGT